MAYSWEEFKKAAENVANQNGYPVGVLLGQAAQETGRSVDSAPGYNFFGHKGTGPAGTQRLLTWEQGSNGPYQTYDYFKKYNTPEESIQDYINLIKNNYPEAWASRNDPVAMINAIKQGGYATDPNYVSSVINTPEFKQFSGNNSQPITKNIQSTPTPEPGPTPTYDKYGRAISQTPGAIIAAGGPDTSQNPTTTYTTSQPTNSTDQNGAWINGRQMWNGQLGPQGVINNPNQQGYGQPVSREVMNQSNPNNYSYNQNPSLPLISTGVPGTSGYSVNNLTASPYTIQDTNNPSTPAAQTYKAPQPIFTPYQQPQGNPIQPQKPMSAINQVIYGGVNAAGSLLSNMYNQVKPVTNTVWNAFTQPTAPIVPAVWHAINSPVPSQIVKQSAPAPQKYSPPMQMAGNTGVGNNAPVRPPPPPPTAPLARPINYNNLWNAYGY